MKGWMIGITGRDAGCFGGASTVCRRRRRRVKEPGLLGGQIWTERGGGAPLVDVRTRTEEATGASQEKQQPPPPPRLISSCAARTQDRLSEVG